MAPPPLRYAVQGFAALRRQESKWAGEKEPQEGIGKSAGEWHFTLELLTKPITPIPPAGLSLRNTSLHSLHRGEAVDKSFFHI
jgi:hypothetical protein